MSVQLYRGDCLEIVPTLPAGSVDLVLTDPPYPDYHVDKYQQTPVDFIDLLDCRQLVFWSAKVAFPLSYSGIHIWNKKIGLMSQYERIFERNGKPGYKVFSHYLINSTVAASFTKDIFTGHPSQKPKALIIELLEYATKPGDTILDPFMGSGTTGVACVETGRNFIGIELDPGYYEIAQRRIEAAQMQIRMPV